MDVDAALYPRVPLAHLGIAPGTTMFFYMNTVVTDHPKTMLDFYNLLNKYVSKGRTNLLDGAEEVVPLALMAIGLDPNTDSAADFAKVKKFLLSIRKGVTTIDMAVCEEGLGHARETMNEVIAGYVSNKKPR